MTRWRCPKDVVGLCLSLVLPLFPFSVLACLPCTVSLKRRKESLWKDKAYTDLTAWDFWTRNFLYSRLHINFWLKKKKVHVWPRRWAHDSTEPFSVFMEVRYPRGCCEQFCELFPIQGPWPWDEQQLKTSPFSPWEAMTPVRSSFSHFRKGLIASPSPWTLWGCSCPKVNPSFNSYKCNLRLAAAWDPYGSAWISPHFPQRQATWLTAPSHSEYRKVSFKKEVGWKNKEYRQDKKMRVTNRPLASVLWMTSTEGFLHFPWEASR